MCTNFDEMDLEPNSEPPLVRNSSPPPNLVDSTKENSDDDEDLQEQLFLRTVPLDDGSIGYVFTCTKTGPLSTWRCHACNFVDTWKNLLKHIDTKWHHESMSRYEHPRSNFARVENAIPDISKGQPLPPGMEEVINGPCQIQKTLGRFGQPLIGLEFLLELELVDFKEPRYLCLLCDKRGDPRSILVHLTSQSHYLMYLRKYFRKFYALIDKLPKTNDSRANLNAVTTHLIAKLEEKFGRLKPTCTRDDVLSISSDQRSMLLQKIDADVHFVESPEVSYLEQMLTPHYVQNTQLLMKDFPLKPKNVREEKADEMDMKSSFNKNSKFGSKKQLRGRSTKDMNDREDSPEVIFVDSEKLNFKPDLRGRSRDRSPYHPSGNYSGPPDHRRKHDSFHSNRYRHSRSRSRSPYSVRRHRSRTPHDRRSHRSPPHSRHPPRYSRYSRRSLERHRGSSPDMRALYGGNCRSHSRSRSPHRSRKDHSPHYRSNSRSNSELKGQTRATEVFPFLDTRITKSRIDPNTKRLFLNEVKELEESVAKELEQYSETPESHPAYQEEWKKFWCARFKELQDEGKCDPHTYDYKPEWITFWNVRVKELYENELRERMKEVKLKYGIPENEDVNLMKLEFNKSPAGESKRPVVDIKTMWKELTGFEIREPEKRNSPSPWEIDDDDSASKNDDEKKEDEKKKLTSIFEDCTQPISPEPLSSISDTETLDGDSPIPQRSLSKNRSKSSRSRSRSRSRSHSRSRSRSRSQSRSHSKFHSREPMSKDEYPFRKPSKKIHFDNPLNVITVLRQLSVLEFQLGSYSNHVVSLLSAGLALERARPQSSVDLLTKENIIFLELVKEKLKGQLLAGVVQKSMVKATLFCIKNIEELLLLAPKMKQNVPPPIPAPPPALLYGASMDPIMPPMHGSLPATSSGLPYGAHVYARFPGPSFRGGHRPYDRGDRKEHFPFRKSPPKKMEQDRFRKSPERFVSKHRGFDEQLRERIGMGGESSGSADQDVVIDEKLIAVQIAEVLTSQGRTNVSEEELNNLINTVVENLKEEQRMKKAAKERNVNESFPASATINTAHTVLSANTTILPMAVPEVVPTPATDFPTIPAGFNLNDVPNSTLAMLQNAFDCASSNMPVAIEALSELEVIKMLRNFKSMPRSKQEKLIEYLRKLEETHPEKVEELKKYVNVA